MTYYRVCPCCGAHLDPGEVCDCRENEKTPANAGGGKVEQSVSRTVSTSYDTRETEDLQAWLSI